MRYAASVVLLLIPAWAPAQGNAAPAPPVAQIVVRGTGQVLTDPDHATVHLSIETRAPNPGQAADASAERMSGVRAALEAAGVGDEDMSTAAYVVRPDTRRDANGNHEIVGYVSRAQLQLVTRSLDGLGALIDVALAAGVDTVGSIQYGVSRLPELRRESLAVAVADARAAAESMAVAAGGQLGAVIEITTELPEAERRSTVVVKRYRPQASEVAQGTAIAVGPLVVSMTVIGRWKFSSSR